MGSTFQKYRKFGAVENSANYSWLAFYLKVKLVFSYFKSYLYRGGNSDNQLSQGNLACLTKYRGTLKKKVVNVSSAVYFP